MSFSPTNFINKNKVIDNDNDNDENFVEYIQTNSKNNKF